MYIGRLLLALSFHHGILREEKRRAAPLGAAQYIDRGSRLISRNPVAQDFIVAYSIMVFSAAITGVSFDRVDNAVLNPFNDTGMIGLSILWAGTALVVPIEEDIFGLDGIPLDTITQTQHIMQGSFDPDAFASGEYVLAIGPAIGAGEEYPVLPVPSVGSTVTLEGKDYTVMAVVDPVMSIDDGAAESGAPASMEQHFILPADAFRQYWSENTLRKLFLNVDDDHIEAVQTWLDDYTATVDSSLPVTSRQTMAAQYESETRSAAVMGNAISTIIALVGVLNFVNSMVTAIVSRKREFAMIQSVGMTKKQLCKMLVYEGLDYAAITLVVSWLVSAFAVGVVIRAMVAGGFTTFHFTLLPLAICTPILLVFAVLIPFICFKNLEKQSIVERLRIE